jgi:hypothetical protein
MATLSSKMLPAGVATLAQGLLADTAVQPIAVVDSLTVNGNAYPSDGTLSNRNLVINGATQVVQRGTSIAGVSTSGYCVTDRFRTNNTNFGTHTVTQASDGPPGFANSYKIAVTTADAAPGVSDDLSLDQRFEGQHMQQLAKGTASAKSVTASFWVKSNKTGTYNLEFDHYEVTAARHIVASYTIDVSGVWEYKTVTFAGDTSSVILDDNLGNIRLIWWLGAGTNYTSGTRATSWATTVNANRAVGNVNLADTVSNYWQITGVQLEVGDTATPFEHRSYGQELALCKRYYNRISNGVDDTPISSVAYYSTTQCYGAVPLDVEMRVGPTLVTSAPALFKVLENTAASTPSAIAFGAPSSSTRPELVWTTTTRGAGNGGFVRSRAGGVLSFDAEL